MGTDRRGYEADWRDQVGPDVSTPMSNSLGTAGLRTIRHDTKGQTTLPTGLHMGRVIEYFPYLSTYRVAIEGGPILQCAAMVHSSTVAWGPSQSISYAPGQDVIVMTRASAIHGIIVGAVPTPVTEPNNWRPDALYGGSNVGYFLDPSINRWTELDENDLLDFSDGRPYDATSGPEDIAQSQTGLANFQDDFMTFMMVDEETGVFGFYDDSLLRVAGHNLQIRSTGLEVEHLNDESELRTYRGEATYLWENMGAYAPNVETSVFILDNQTDDNGEPTGPIGDELTGIRYGFVQPVQYDQQAFHRIVEYGGYLGQGGYRAIMVPGPDVEGNENEIVNTYLDEPRWLTLLQEHRTLAGRYVMAGTGGMMMIKTPPLVTPKRRNKPESPLGDRGDEVAGQEKNYDPAGLPAGDQSAESPHYIVAEIPIEDPPTDGGVPVTSLADLKVPPEVLRSATIADEIAYEVSWEGLHTFHYHERDFFLPDESDLDEYNKVPTPPYSSLARVQHLGDEDESPYPETISVKVDHRHGSVKIYLNKAILGIQPNGSIVLQSGCGCEIKSENGNLVLAAPGDIKFQPGRNVVMLAGNDMVMKARNSIDLTATEGDVRMLAWNNMMLASAVSETGVMLLQSFSKCVLDPEVENLIVSEDTSPEPGDPNDPPAEPTGPQYNMGQDVIGSGILLKSRRAQVTLSSYEANIEVGRKKYDQEEEDGYLKPADVDPETQQYVERDWSWAPGRIRFSAEKGQIESFASYVVDYLMDPAPFTSDGAEDSPPDASGASMQVFLRTKEVPTDDPDVALNPQGLPPNILAAAGVADLSSINTCQDTAGKVCYEVTSVNEFRADRTTICATLMVNRELFVGGCGYFRGNLTTLDHLDVNYPPTNFDGQLVTLRPDLKAVFDEADTRCLQLLPPMMAESAKNFIDTISGAWLDFSCRTEEQYGTKDNFVIMETWWQHQVRLEAERAANQNPDPDNLPPPDGAPEETFNFYPDLPEGITYWTETYIETLYANMAQTAPYPGVAYIDTTSEEEPADPNQEPDPVEEANKAKRCYGVYTLSLVDEVTGRNRDRNELANPDDPEGYLLYEDPQLKRGAVRQLDHYLAIEVKKPEEEEQDPQVG